MPIQNTRTSQEKYGPDNTAYQEARREVEIVEAKRSYGAFGLEAEDKLKSSLRKEDFNLHGVTP